MTQKELIQELRDNNKESWLLVLDAARYDILSEYVINRSLNSKKSDGVVNNGNVNCTLDWFNTMFNDKIDGHLFHGGNPIKSIDAGADYNENEHFSEVPSQLLYRNNRKYELSVPGPYEVNKIVKLHIREKDEMVEERLEALGYKESKEYDNYFNFNVVRYIQPHTPYRKLKYTDINDWGPNYERAIINMIEGNFSEGNPPLTYNDLIDLYVDNLKWAYNAALELAEHLDGNVVITSDHGECFGECGAWFHGDEYHEHMINVPWMVIQ